MKKIFEIMGIIFFCLIIVGFIFSKKEYEKNEPIGVNTNLIEQNTQKEKETKSQYVLSKKERVVIKSLLMYEFQSFLNDEETYLFDNDILKTNAYEVARSYEINQVNADQNFFKRKLKINGRVVSINSGIGNEPYIALLGTNEFLSPQIHFTEPNIEKISQTRKGDLVAFVCDGNGAILGTPMFDNCKFAEDYAAYMIKLAASDIDRFLNDEPPQMKTTEGLVLTSLVLANKIPDESPCIVSNNSCQEEFDKRLTSITKVDLETVKNQLEASGLILNH